MSRSGSLRGPDGWQAVPLRRIATCRDDLRAPVNAVERAMRPGDIPYWGANSVQGTIDVALVNEPVVLLGEDGAPFFDVDRPVAFFVDEPIWPNNHIHVLVPRAGVSARWLAHALNAVDYSLVITGSTRDKLTQAAMLSIQLLVPPLAEQIAIADYLDEQTARIDTLIAKQNQLIETLRERRMGAIAQALGYGLASGNVSPSGLDWLEFVPSTWRPVQVKNFGDVSLGKMLQPANSGADVRAPYMRAANVQPDGVLQVEDVKEMWFAQKALNGLELLSGDVVVVEGGVGGFGRAAYLREDLDGWGFQNSILRVRPFDGNDGRYLTYALLLARSSGYVRTYCNIVSMPHFTAEKLAAFRLCCPPPGEQREIADYLDIQTAKIDALIAKTQEHIALAKERRAALIAAAVTGQFDVRTAVQKVGA